MYNTDLPTRTELPGSKQLLRSTIIAIIIAAALLVTVVLPAEYGIDPTGVGRLLGLTQMGNIKMQLADEAEKHRTSSVIPPVEAAGAPTQTPSPEAHGASPAPTHTATNSDTAQKTDETIVTI